MDDSCRKRKIARNSYFSMQVISSSSKWLPLLLQLHIPNGPYNFHKKYNPRNQHCLLFLWKSKWQAYMDCTITFRAPVLHWLCSLLLAHSSNIVRFVCVVLPFLAEFLLPLCQSYTNSTRSLHEIHLQMVTFRIPFNPWRREIWTTMRS